MKRFYLLSFSLIVLSLVHAQNDYFVKFSVGGGLTIPNNAFLLKNSLGISAFVNLDQKVYLETGVAYTLFNLNNYENNVIYTSYWANGAYYSKIKKKASFCKSYIKVPILFNLVRKKLIYGLGISIEYIIQSKLDQSVSGSYRNDNYPDSEVVLTKSIKSIYEIHDYSKLDNLRRTNLWPCLIIGKQLNSKLIINASIEYSLFPTLQYTRKIEPFNSLNFSINTFYKLTN